MSPIVPTQLTPSELQAFNARRLLRETAENSDACLESALFAVSEGNLETTVASFQTSCRHDLALKALTSCDQWNEAINYAHKYAKDMLRVVYFELGKKHELQRNYRSAIRAFERANVHLQQVPRMLVTANQLEELQSYVRSKNCKELWVWWGRYCESIGEIEDALDAYQKANDTLSITKFLWSQNKIQEAVKIASEANDIASLFYLGRQFEAMEMADNAIDLFTLSGHLKHSLRIAKVYGKDDFILELASRGSIEDILDAALYFERKEQFSTASKLYSKIGNFSRAIDLCLREQRVESIEDILEDFFGNNAAREDVKTVQKIVSALIACGNVNKAIQLLCEAKDLAYAFELVQTHAIQITEELADKLSPDINGTTGAVHEKEQKQALRELHLRIAKTCKEQGSFFLAAKKYSEAGERVKAMKCLIKSGDREKIIPFASRSRCPEVLTITGNYLRTLDWFEDENLKEKIVLFYTKAKAHKQLAVFHETQAQLEIDEFRDYERGLVALQSAKSALEKLELNKGYPTPSTGPGVADKDEDTKRLEARIEHISRFLRARSMLQSDSETAFGICYQLLRDLNCEDKLLDLARLHSGDVYSLLIEFSFMNGDKQKCHKLLEEMDKQGLPIELYIESSTIQECRNVDLDALEEPSTIENDIH